MSPVETWCHNINYYIPDDEDATKEFSTENMTRIRKFYEHFQSKTFIDACMQLGFDQLNNNPKYL